MKDDEDNLEKKRSSQPRANRLKEEAQEVKGDLDSLKTNVVGLARNLKDVGTDKVQVAAGYLRERVEDLKETSTDTMRMVEERIQSKPTQSIVIAFAAGVLASYILGRRSK
jgi:ElaB/YqjD/DUF883 family membrane-anchored ribosome-binding protein